MRKIIENYINENYDALQEYPWEKYPKFTTFKHKNNKKWFALIMEEPYQKFHIDKEKICGLIDISYDLTGKR